MSQKTAAFCHQLSPSIPYIEGNTKAVADAAALCENSLTSPPIL
jgi:hypothetical protein